MPEREEYDTDYDFPLPPYDLGCWLRYRLSTGPGKIRGFVIQLEVQINERTYPIVRYDCAHHQPHRDTMDATGRVIAKEWLPFDYTRAFNHADKDIKANWRRYHEEFMRGMV